MRILLRALARVVEAGDVLEFKKPAKKSGSKPSTKPGVSYDDQKTNKEKARQEQNERIIKELKNPSSGGGGGGGGGQPQRGSDPYHIDQFEYRKNAGAVDSIVVSALSEAWKDLHSDYGNDLLHAVTSTNEDIYHRVMGTSLSYALSSGYYPASLNESLQEEWDDATLEAQDMIWDEHEEVLLEAGISESENIDYEALSDIDQKIADAYDEARDEAVGGMRYFISMGVFIEDDETVVVFSDADIENQVDDPDDASFVEEVTFDSPMELKIMLQEALINAVKAVKAN